MTTTHKLLRRVFDAMGPHKKYPIHFMEYPEANVLIDAAPKMARALEVAMATLLRITDSNRELGLGARIQIGKLMLKEIETLLTDSTD